MQKTRAAELSQARIRVEPATAADAEALRRAAASAFAVDEGLKPEGALPGGPPGPDRLDRQREWIRRWDTYKACLGETLVGGCIVRPRWDAVAFELFGLFVHARYMGRGYGRRLLLTVMDRYPADAGWFLETPDYAVGNHRFYEGCGFRLQHRSPVDSCLGFGFYTYAR